MTIKHISSLNSICAFWESGNINISKLFFFLLTQASDFPKIKNSLSVILVKLRTKMHFFLNKAIFAYNAMNGRTIEPQFFGKVKNI